MKLLLWPLKIAVFALVVLVLGHVVQIRGRTVSDQVKVQMSTVRAVLKPVLQR